MDCCAVRGIPSSRFAFFTAASISFCCFLDSFLSEKGVADTAFLDFFLLMDNFLYLLLEFILTDESCVVIVRAIRPHPGANDFRLNEVVGDLL